jgi:hypothetical protein
MAAKPVNTEPSEQVSPFMRLPAEVRLAIYGLALQDTINITKATTTASQWPCARLEGALALLQTSKSIRVDSRHELLTLVLVHNDCMKMLELSPAFVSARTLRQKTTIFIWRHSGNGKRSTTSPQLCSFCVARCRTGGLRKESARIMCPGMLQFGIHGVMAFIFKTIRLNYRPTNAC